VGHQLRSAAGDFCRETGREAADSLLSRDDALETASKRRLRLGTGADAHPAVLELVERHAVAIVGHCDTLVLNMQNALGRVSIVRVLDQLDERDFRILDEALTELAEHSALDGEAERSFIEDLGAGHPG
jgi:hypothetical protein